MTEIYAILIINSRRTFDSIPASMKDAVEARLKEKGYGTDGKRITAEVTE